MNRPANGELTAAEATGAVRRNLFLLAASMAALFGMIELAAGSATLTFKEVGGSDELAGLAPALFLIASGLAAFPAGRAMDHFGRVPVLAVGFAIGILGTLSGALGCFTTSMVPVLVGFALVGITAGTVILSRAAAVDMHPPQERPRAVALVLFGAVFGALLGPVVFVPLTNASAEDSTALGLAWLGASGFMLVGLLVVSQIRPDPQRIARALNYDQEEAGGPAAPLSELIARPGVPAALVATLAIWATMTSTMTLFGGALVDHGDHSQSAVFPVIAAHFVGMFGLFPVVGRAIERYGRTAAMVGGLFLLAVSASAVAASIHVLVLAAISMFGIGIGWSLCFVAATAQLSEAANAGERGRLIGFADLTGDCSGGALAVVGGVGLATAGITAVGLGAATLAALAGAWILLSSRAATPEPA